MTCPVLFIILLFLTVSVSCQTSETHYRVKRDTDLEADKQTTWVYITAGYYRWDLLPDIEHVGTSTGGEQTIEIKTIQSYNPRIFSKTFQKAAINTNNVFNLANGFDILKVKIQGDVTNNQSINNFWETMTPAQLNPKTPYFAIQSVHVKVNDTTIPLYQLVFNGPPGIGFQTAIISSTPRPFPKPVVIVELEQPVRVLKEIDVIYCRTTDCKPSNSIKEAHGMNDIKDGFRGYQIYLVPIWTNRLEEGANSFNLTISDIRDKKYKDLNRLEKVSDYRYLKPMNDPTSKFRIIEIQLYRNGPKRSSYENYGCSNLNFKDKRRMPIFLCWKSVEL